MATNVFDLFAKISLDSKDYEKGLDSASSKFSRFADGLKSAAGKVGDVLAGIGKVAAAGIGAAGTALTALTKQSLDAVANYEQLVGGVDKIFGESSKKVQQYADEAFQTAGMSSNEYMETVTGFSASLIQGLKGDTEQAAEIANMAIKDMADNANTYGTDIAQIQSNYQALAKQNYTLLDNLKLGYGGTKAEMARLLNDANKLDDTILGKGIEVDDKFEDVTFDQMIRAIHTIQEELKITGTTSKEASGTISGSLGSMRAAWQNFLTGTGDAEQFTKILSGSIENIRKNLNKILPRLTEGLTELVDLLAPEIPPIIEETLPVIIDSSSTLLTSLAERLPELLRSILPSLATGVVNVTVALVGIMPQLISALKDSIPIVVKTIMEKKGELLQAGKDIIKALFPTGTQGIQEIAGKATEIVGNFAIQLTNPKNLTTVFNTGLDIINAIANGLLSEESIDKFVEAVPQIILNLATALTNFIQGEDGEGGLLGAVYNIVDRFCDYFDDPENREEFFKAAEDIIITLGDFLVENVGKLAEYALKIAQRLAEMLVTAIIDQFMQLWDSESGWMEEYLAEDTNLTYQEWAEQRHERERRENTTSQSYNDSVNLITGGAGGSAAASAFYSSQHIKGYADGFVADRPTWIGGRALIGEDGTEALLPLENNTGWMDMFADKLGARMGGGVVIEQMIINAPSGNAEDIQAAFLDTLDEALRNRQITQNRGVGAVVWK